MGGVFRLVGIQPARRNRAGSDGVDGHVSGSPFACRTFAQGMHSAPRRAGMCIVRPAMPDVGDDIDDGTAITLHPTRIDFTHEDEAAGEIATYNSFEAL